MRQQPHGRGEPAAVIEPGDRRQAGERGEQQDGLGPEHPLLRDRPQQEDGSDNGSPGARRDGTGVHAALGRQLQPAMGEHRTAV
jgi:hypothetical protein